MTYSIKLTSRAQKDIEELYRWVVRRAPHQGTAWYNGFLTVLESLSRHPQRCSIVIEGSQRKQPVRQLIYGHRPYRIFFWIINQEVHILHVRRGARRPWN